MIERPKTAKEAFDMVLYKWHPDNPDQGIGSCGFCLYFRKGDDCTDCPICIGEDRCDGEDHPHMIWAVARDGVLSGDIWPERLKTAADDMYEFVLSKYENFLLEKEGDL